MLIFFTLCWLVASLVSVVVWARTAKRGHGWIVTQRLRGENGVLRLIAMQKYRMALVAVVIAALMLSVLVSVLLPLPLRQFYGRTALTLVAVLFAFMGWQFGRYSDQIMARIRDEYAAKQGGS